MISMTKNLIRYSDKQISFLEKLSSINTKFQGELSPSVRKKNGMYFTAPSFTDEMVKKMFESMAKEDIKNIHKKSFFEPCVGIGSFVFSYLKFIHQNFSLCYEEKKELIQNIYVADSNEEALSIFTNLFIEFCDVFFEINVTEEAVKKNTANALIYDVSKNSLSYIHPEELFSIDRFDIIMTNPPYKNFRAESKHYIDSLEYANDKDYYTSLKKLVSERFTFQGKGTLNLYKIFTEEIVKNYSKKGSYVYLLIPQSILKDVSSTEIRKFIFTTNKVISIINISESSNIVDAKQAMTALLIKTQEKSEKIEIIDNFQKENEYTIYQSLNQIQTNLNSAVISLKPERLEKFEHLKNHPTVKDLPFIKNLRGELDVTLNKSYIINDGEIPLIKGRNLGTYVLNDTNIENYVDSTFFIYSKKKQYTLKERIACHQIANMNKQKRLMFSYIPPGNVLANSCNFISIEENKYGIDIYFLMGVFNSDLINWYFNLFSSNNHINNYEIDNFPVPIHNPKLIKLISKTVQEYINHQDPVLLAKINSLSHSLLVKKESNNSSFSLPEGSLKSIFVKYDLNDLDFSNVLSEQTTPNEFLAQYDLSAYEKKVINHSIEKFKAMNKGSLMNFFPFKLSELDMEIIKSVKPGGNWSDIPLKTAKKSKRIMKIRETGGRTTLYGRLSYDKPSYTINTYFNRPGNGTHIHPSHDRVLTVREAARIQSFPDDFYFYGNQKNLLSQVGNAVPPLFSYLVAEQILSRLEINGSLDLFCGAGGMTLGLKQAGLKSLLCTDFDEAACITLQSNYPETEVFHGDITSSKVKKYIIDTAIHKNVDIITGGPPCQGFSLAGFRNPDDPRNNLIEDFYDVVKNVQPKIFLFENVQGLLSYNKGETFKDLMILFDSINYKVEAKLLDFSEFAIPQKRKRVIVIGVRKDLSIAPGIFFPEKVTPTEKSKITIRNAIKDIEDISFETRHYIHQEIKHPSSYIKAMRKEITFKQYFDSFQLFNPKISEQLSLLELKID